MKEMKQEKQIKNQENRKTGSEDTAGLVLPGEPLRTYKDRVFRMLFKDKKKFLELYNAMNGTEYDKPEDLSEHTAA